MAELSIAVDARSRGVQALQVLTRWLKLRPTVTDKDLNKICKGLFYTFWHSDKQPVQVSPWLSAIRCS